MLTIQIQIRSVYGEEKAYPINHEASCVARIAGTKTLTKYSLMQILAMGATIVELDRHGRPCRSYTASDVSRLPMVA